MRQSARHISWLLAAVPICTMVFAQSVQVKFDHLTHEQELSQSTVNAIAQDTLGYLWFGTQDGLNRFDGYAISVFKHAMGDTTTLADNSIWCLLSDSYGDLWIGTMRGGADRYRPTENRFYHYTHRPEDSTSLSENTVIALFEDSDRNLWLGTLNNGLNRFERATNRFTRYRYSADDPQSLSNNTVWSVCEDRDRNLWVATWRGLCRARLDERPIRFQRYVHDARNPAGLGADNIRVLYVDRAGTLWVGTWGAGLDRFDAQTQTFRHYRHDPKNARTLSSNLVLSIYQDRRGNLWVGTGDAGLNLYHPESDSFERFRHDPQDPSSLNNNIVSAIFEDRAGTLWIGTGAGGVNMLDWRRNRFAHYRDIPGNPDDMHGNDVWAILEDSRGELWIGTYGSGLNRFDRRRKSVVNYRFDPNNPRSLSHNNVLSLCETPDGAVWVGTEGGGLNRFDRASGRFTRYRHSVNPNTISHDEITALRVDRHGNLWIGNNGGSIDVLDLHTHTFRHYKADEANPGALAGTSIMCIYEDPQGTIWIGSLGGGLLRYDPARDAFVRYSTSSPGQGLNTTTVLSIYEDDSGVVWIGTYGGGLNRFEKATGKFSYFTYTEGLPNDVVYGILPDGRGNLWLSTNKGLARFTPASGVFRRYDVKDGLQGNEFNQGAYFRSLRGELFFGGLNGFNAFFPDSIKENEYVPPVYLTSFKVFDKPIEIPPSLTGTTHLRLSYDQNFFSFEFVALNFISPEKNRYAYMLEGLDRDWIVASATRRYASYTNLDPGKYVLRVKASNNDGIWNEHGIALAITITPPYWRTWWFQLLVVMAAAGILSLMYRYRVNKLLEIERIRSSIATDLHDDIGSTLTEIALYSDVGLRELRTKKIPQGDGTVARVEALLESIGATSRVLIDAMNDIVWAVDPKNDSFEFLLLRMKTHAARMFDAKGINYEIDIPEELSQLHLPLGFRRRFYLIYKEAVNNIIRHAQASKVALTIRKEGRWLVMTIVDDGKGFDLTKVSEGNGVNNMKQRAEALDGVLELVSAPGAGTTVKLRARIP
jgi:two-component system sensor histidine kinase ChiS